MLKRTTSLELSLGLIADKVAGVAGNTGPAGANLVEGVELDELVPSTQTA